MSNRILSCLVWAALVGPSPIARAVVYPLHVRAYCPAGSNCGEASLAEYRSKTLAIVGEMNRYFEVANISFQPTVFDPIDDGNFSNLPGCATGQANSAKRTEWLLQVGVQNPTVVTMMVTTGPNTCCADPPDGPYGLPPISEAWSLYGLFCDVSGTVEEQGSVWAHEMGHYFCLRHTFTNQDQIETFPAPPNYDGDPAYLVFDTAPDPGVREGSDVDGDGNHLLGHEWCDRIVLSGAADPGSPNPDLCAPDCVQFPLGTVSPSSLAASPPLTALMSYYKTPCKGPVVVNGVTRPGFSPQSVANIGFCQTLVAARANLDQLCTEPGNGDPDHDGICASGDNCKLVPNTDQANLDGDSLGDACDACKNIPGPGIDLDGDGLCDPDSDGDGCIDSEDQHPYEGEVHTGTQTNVGCGSTKKIYSSEGVDADGDGLPSCKDPDDDDDRICDEAESWPAGTPGAQAGCSPGPDPCPYTDGICTSMGIPNDCQDDWHVCLTGGCVEFLLKMISLINPDPVSIDFPTFEIANEKLYVPALPGHALSETAKALTGGFEIEGFGGQTLSPALARLDGAAPIRLEIWRKQPETLVATVASFDLDQLAVGEIRHGTHIEVSPDIDPETGELRRLSVAATWGVALDPGQVPFDADSDGVPDAADNCTAERNADQRDSDRDGFGNACDPDTDGSGLVDPADVAYVRSCTGVDIALDTAISEPADDAEFSMGGYEVPLPAADALARSLGCRAADVNGDGAVTSQDEAFVDARLGSSPGPSARTGVDLDADGRLDAVDNCPLVFNPDQLDLVGVGAGSGRDGIGDACQCGNVDALAGVTPDDTAQLRSWLVRSVATLRAPSLCNARGPSARAAGNATADCDLVDLVVLRRALGDLAPGIEQQCGV